MFILTTISFILIYCKSIYCQEDLQNHEVADPKGIYHIFWTSTEDIITIELQVKTKGYVGFGFSPNGGMKGADVIIGWVYPNQTSVFHDRHALGNFEPIIDEVQNYQLLKASENATHTILRFTRKLNTCDKEDMEITDDTTRVIFSWHPDDPQNETGLPYHEEPRRGTKNIYFLNLKPPSVEITGDIYMWDIFTPNVSIPPQLTTYWCFTVKLPHFDEPHYYVGFDIDHTPGMEQMLHHLQVNECSGKEKGIEERARDLVGFQCVQEGAVLGPDECQPPLILNAIGAPGSSYPKGIGRVVGQEYGGSTYFSVQVHYNNPEKKAGNVDHTRIRVYLTKKTPEKKASIWQLYSNFDYTLVIPPQQQSFVVTAYFPKECTQQALPKDGVTIFAAGVHAHGAGRQISLRHFRGNNELPPIVVDNQYDYNFQQLKQLRKTVTVLPGDLLMAQCNYNTMDRNETVPGSYGTLGEMCFVYIYHYPSTDIVIAIGGPDYKTIQNFFGAQEMEDDLVHIKSPANLRNYTIHDLMKNYNWKNASDESFQQMRYIQNEGVKYVQCLNGWAGQNKVTKVTVEYPSKAEFYKVVDKCDTQQSKSSIKPKQPYY